jgi:hypothetical protein
MSTLHQCIIQ